MILQALTQYYRRMEESGNALAPEGWIDRPIDYVVKLDINGRCIGVIGPQIDPKSKKKAGTTRRVPNIGKQALKHTNSGVDANLLWDNSGFSLGLGPKGEKKLSSFLSVIDEYFVSTSDAGLVAVRLFLQEILKNPSGFIEQFPDEKEDLSTGRPTVAFQLVDDDSDLVCQRPAIRSAYEEARRRNTDRVKQQCLVTGELDEIELTHPVIKGIRNGQTSGGSIVSFNERAFESFGKQDRQGLNAPVGKQAAFAYTTALNHLLRNGSRQKIQVGDATTVFWCEKNDDIEDVFCTVFGEADNPHDTEVLRSLLQSVEEGKFDGGRGERRFFVLGLAPNNARVSIRLWQALPLKELGRYIHTWFNDISIARAPHDPEFPSLFRLLTACAVQNKADNIPPNLGGDIMRAILSGSPYPASWLNAAVQRNRAERDVSYYRAAAIKACLNRIGRTQSNHTEFQSMLDVNNTNVAYRLGRLFSALEKVQEEANPGINATIRDRYYGAASSTPVAVFTTLLRLKNHHIGKIENKGRATNFEKLFGEILAGIKDFPAHLSLQDQGRFALGYYHQRQSFFTKSE